MVQSKVPPFVKWLHLKLIKLNGKRGACDKALAETNTKTKTKAKI